MESEFPSTCQYKILYTACKSIGENPRFLDRISIAGAGNWDVIDWRSNSSPDIQNIMIRYNIRQMHNKMPPAIINDFTPLWRLNSHDLERVKKSNENMINIVRHLINTKRYILAGNWVCFEDGDKNERIPSYCENNKWQELLERESLIKYLKSERGLVEQREFFRKQCNKCLKKWQITSFFLYKSVMDVEVSQIDYYSSQIKRHRCITERPHIEVICHLVWNKHYRVFGNWRCLNRHCRNEWVSAYTWISLRKFIDEIPANSLTRHDFYAQECNKCKGKNKNKGKIWKYAPLELSDSDGPHKSHLCARCQLKEYCFQSGTYFG